MKKVKRNLEVRVQSLLSQFPVVALMGARQVGKTELAKTAGKNWKYFDLENPGDLNRIQLDPDVFFSENPDSIILDEAQEFPDLFKILRGVVDQDRNKKGRYILTGSSSPLLLKNISETLAGRVATIEVGTLKANEFYQRPLSPLYDCILNGALNTMDAMAMDIVSEIKPQMTVTEMRKFWFQGGYPEPTLTNDADFYRQWMEEYQKTYIERDIRKLFPNINSIRYRKFISLLAELSGTIINKSELAGLLEVSQPTVNQYINIADGTFVWRILPSFSKSKSKSLVKMPKGHQRDSGLLHFLTRVPDLERLLYSPRFGSSFESFVIEEIIKGLTAAGASGWSYSYYRTRSRAEIDLVLEGYFGFIPVEIKFSSKAESKDIAQLKVFIEEYKAPYGILINQSSKVEKLTPNIVQIPVGML